MKRSILLLWGLSLAFAVQLDLSPQDLQRAIREGTAMNTPSNGYILKDYLLKEYNSGVSLKPGAGEVDAVVVATPYERIRYTSYLEALQQRPMTIAKARAVLGQYRGKVTFVIFAHSPYTVDAEVEQFRQAYGNTSIKDAKGHTRQRSFLDNYKSATLEVGDKTYTARPSVDGPYTDIFSIQGSRPESRYLGLISYSFDLGHQADGGRLGAKGILRFKDSLGRTEYALDVELSRYF